jgi:toxin YoeB
MRKVVFSKDALDGIQKFKTGNQNLAFKVFELLVDIQKNPFSGIGKPEPLKGNLQGCWSRRINDEHRLVYKLTDDSIEIISCFGHY